LCLRKDGHRRQERHCADEERQEARVERRAREFDLVMDHCVHLLHRGQIVSDL
jgi:hypothetical protein